MTRRFAAGAALLLALAACQAPPTASSPAPGGSASPADSPSATPSNGERVLLSGRIYDDTGKLVTGARLTATLLDTQQVLTASAGGGAYSVTDVPVGSRVLLRAEAEGFTPRERRVRAVSVKEYLQPGDPNQSDFGGSGVGRFEALSQAGELAEVSPENGDRLALGLKFSHPFDADARLRLRQLLRLVFDTVSGTSTAPEVYKLGDPLGGGTIQGEWSEDGKTLRIVLPVPVNGHGTGASVEVGFAQSPPSDGWITLANGRAFGNGLVPTTYDAADVRVTNAFAPVLRPNIPEPSASPPFWPTAQQIWGERHATGVRFVLKENPSEGLKLLSLYGVTGRDGDRLILKFDRPMWGLPHAAQPGTALSAASYRIVLGRDLDSQDRGRFDKADPRTEGGAPPLDPAVNEDFPDQVILHYPSGALANVARFKVYLSPELSTPSGVRFGSQTADGATLPNTWTGEIQ